MTLFIFGSVPKDSGTFTFYRTIRKGLLAEGIDMRCLSVGYDEATLWNDQFADEGCLLLAAKETSVKRQAQIFTTWCEDNKVDLVMAVNSIAILSALPHLPQQIRVISRCANAFDHGYKISLSCYERLHRVVALAPKQIQELTTIYGAEKSRIVLIPNATKVERFELAAAKSRGEQKVLSLGFLGRIEHKQKGVLFLPEILQSLHDKKVAFKLTIAGKGIHDAELKSRLDFFVKNNMVKFIGQLHPDEIPEFLANTDIFLFPSLFEGSPNALIEAMMAGSVPAAWDLKGIIDCLVEDGVTGVLSEPADTIGLADKIALLAFDRPRLKIMSENVSSWASKNLSQTRLVKDYKMLIESVMNEPVKKWQPKLWKEFEVDKAFHATGWRRLIPKSIKRLIKSIIFQTSE